MALWHNPLDIKYFPASSTSLKQLRKLHAMFLLSLGHILVINRNKPSSDAPIPNRTLSKVPVASGGGGGGGGSKMRIEESFWSPLYSSGYNYAHNAGMDLEFREREFLQCALCVNFGLAHFSLIAMLKNCIYTCAGAS